MSSEKVLNISPIRGVPWQTFDPFLFCVYHQDQYPAGNERLGPAASLSGRNIGMDFEGKDGWRMYHGSVVPGFPQHPHRGFETVTIMRKGYIDHSDSLGATARFGRGDVQWLTAGKGIVHCEMFPLLNPREPNPAELFQIWLNLPSSDKFVEPYFSMFWDQDIPRHTILDANGRATEILVVAGNAGNTKAPPPPPNSWAARTTADVAIWTIKMAPEAQWTLPAATAGTNRTLYLFRGKACRYRRKSHDAQLHGAASARFGCRHPERKRRSRVSPAAGKTYRRACRAVRPLRDEFEGGDSASFRGLPANRIRRVAVACR